MSDTHEQMIERAACGREMRRLWEKYGIYVLVQSLADVVEADVFLGEQTGLFPDEVETKGTMVRALRTAAASPCMRDE